MNPSMMRFATTYNGQTHLYEYKTVVEPDRYLVPFYNIETKTKFANEGNHIR